MKRQTTRSLFSIGIYYFLFVEILTLLVLRCPAHQEHFDKDKQYFSDLAASIHNQIEQLQSSNGQSSTTSSSSSSSPSSSTPTKSKQETIPTIEFVKDTSPSPPSPSSPSSIPTKHMGIFEKMVGEIPLNFTFDFENSTVSVPLSMVAQNLNISDVHMYSPSVNFPLEFVSQNMTYNITIEADNIPMSITLNPTNSVIPLSLSIDGNNQIPVTLDIQKIETPLFNWIAIGILGALNFIALAFVVYQQTAISTLKRRLDEIDVCNDVARGKRVQVGNRWFKSINNNDDHENDESDPILNSSPSPSLSSPRLHQFCSLCTQCGQVNGKTSFCFNCGNRLTLNAQVLNMNQ